MINLSPGAIDQAGNIKDFSLSQYGQLWMAGREGQVNAGGLNEPLKPYQQSLWVYKCVRALATTASGIPLRISTGSDGLKYSAKTYRAIVRRAASRTLRPVKGRNAVCFGRAADGEIVEGGDAYELIEGPNNHHDWPRFFTATIGYLMTRGSVAWVMADMAGRKPRAMHVIDGKYIEPVWLKGDNEMPELIGYEYRPPQSGRKIPLAIDEVKYWALWDDSDKPLGGLSPHSPARLSIATDYNASLYNAYSLVNGCEPGLTVSFPQALTPEQRSQYRAELMQRYQGAAKAKKPLVLEGGASAEAMGAAMKDMEFNEGKRTTRLEICAAYDVPPVVAGWVDAAGDSSAYTENALRQFYQQAIFPLLDSFAPAIQEIVARFDGRLVVWFDVEDQPVVQEMRLSRIDSATKLHSLGVPKEDINDLLDLGLPRRPGDDVGFLPSTQMPVEAVINGMPPVDEGDTSGEIPAEPPEDPGEGDEPEDDKAKSSKLKADNEREKARNDAIWHAWQRSWAPLAVKLAHTLRGHYSAVERRVKRLLAEAEDGDKAAGQKADELDIAQVLFEVFDDPKENAKFVARVRPAVADSYELGIRQALSEAGMRGEPFEQLATNLPANPAITHAMQSDAIRVTQHANARTRYFLRNQLVEGAQGGESINQLADRVQGVLQNSRNDALRQARNYVGQSLSTARRAGANAAGMTHKRWLYSRGPGERRPAHVAAEAKYKSGILIDQPFVINADRLDRPRDPNGSPGEIVNCQCLARYSRGPKDAAVSPAVFYRYDDLLRQRRAAATSVNHADAGTDVSAGQGEQPS